MPATLQCIVLDCPEPVVLARFYQALAGGEVDRPDPRWRVDEDFATLHLDGLVLGFQRSFDYRPPRWPDPGFPQQFHLDFEVDDFRESHRRVLQHGGRLLDPDLGGRGWRVYADPAGHPFCLLGDY
ncbi:MULTISPECIES: VOC family protein [unclassified Amycolatopsis]|uniref:VOC family protein n=1 Tax=unclassified Amycolatopsis TaxID=2618356 RepID=UPI001FF2E28D|nr:VOC family protein [Amycolatopsis sp. FBCC-B4732]UOX84658.1 VOC family protein [Amycolatopsis sp. FBCC-B4732]